MDRSGHSPPLEVSAPASAAANLPHGVQPPLGGDSPAGKILDRCGLDPLSVGRIRAMLTESRPRRRLAR